MASQPDAVENATNLLLRVPHRAEQHLPPGTSIMEVYDEAEHELLILGEPGAGKSTLLLDLAQQLVGRAEEDPTHPLPVILPLSSWAVKRPPLQDWMAEQLAEIYDIPRKLSTQWVQEGNILPLLDGLDEVEETARPACITAINTYHRDHLAQLVICSRTIEYEVSAERQRLALQRAVILQPLTHEYVNAYLVQAGKPLTALRSTLKKNAALHGLATKPLMLNILILTYQGAPVRDLPNKESLLIQQVWDDYVQRMTYSKGNSKRYPLKETRSWLGWLARQMLAHNQTVFYLEHLQPDWLASGQRQAYAWLAVRLPAIVIGVLINILVQSFFQLPSSSGDSVLTPLLQYGILGGLLGGLWHGSMREVSSLFQKGVPFMNSLSISDCCHMLDIDPKTLRQWLAQAQMSLHQSPTDARVKCLTSEQVNLLASLHGRALQPSGLPPKQSSPKPDEGPVTIGSTDLDLRERPAQMEAQVTTLQTQVTDLTLQLLREREQRSEQRLLALETQLTLAPLIGPSVPYQPEVPFARHPTEKRVRLIPLIECTAKGSYVLICPKEGELHITPDSPEWFAWLASLSSFRFVGKCGRFSARRGYNRRPNRCWYAQRHIHQKSYSKYLGVSENVTTDRLEQVAAHFQLYVQ